MRGGGVDTSSSVVIVIVIVIIFIIIIIIIRMIGQSVLDLLMDPEVHSLQDHIPSRKRNVLSFQKPSVEFLHALMTCYLHGKKVFQLTNL